MRGLLAGLLVAFACGSASAQQASIERVLLVPATPGGWVVEVTTTGGFTGRGLGNFAVAGDGTMACTLPFRCAGIAQDGARRVARAVAGVTTTAWTQPSSGSICSDCVTTTMTIRRRAGDGSEQSTTYSWTVASTKDVPADVQNVFDAALAVIEQRR